MAPFNLLEQNDVELQLIRPTDEPTTLLLDFVRAGYGPGTPLGCITGGCGEFTQEDAWLLIDRVVKVLGNYRGPLLFGGSQMERLDTGEILASVTEIAPRVAARNKNVLPIGITPFQGMLRPRDIYDRGGRIVLLDDQTNSAGVKYRTIVHPGAHKCFLIQKSIEPPLLWNANLEREYWSMEWKLRLQIALLGKAAGMRPFLLVSNGGQVTRDEVEAWLRLSLPVFFFKGTGRAADEYAALVEAEKAGSEERRVRYSSAFVVENNETSFHSLMSEQQFV